MQSEMAANLRINWDEIERFTPALYHEYERAPLWEIDSPDFHSEADYHNYWSQMAQQFVISSKAVIGRWQARGKESTEALERNANPSTPVFDFDSALATQPLPLAKSQIQEKVALLSSNPARPLIIQQQESQAQYVAALNQLEEMVLEDNNYEMLYAKGNYDIQFWNTAIYKWTVNPREPGIFAEPGKIRLEKVSPDTVFFDPQCEELHCDYMDYCIQKHTMEIGEIQTQYPLAGHLVSADGDEKISDTSVSARNNEDYIQSPQPKLARDAAGRRQKISVLEVWIKDSRTHFVPEIKDPDAKTYEARFLCDDDGYIMGTWQKRYPDGRLLICTGNKVLKDLANPFPHGQFPFVFAIGGPSVVPYADGEAQSIMTVTRKINNMYGKIHAYYQSEVERPMHKEAGAIMDPALDQQIPNGSTYAIELAPGKMLERPDAKDIPPLVLSYITSLQGILDLTSGSSSVMRGTISDGAQLSAEALSALQNFASSRLALSAKFFNAAMRQLFYQLMWILRATVRQKIKVKITLPDGTNTEIDWESDHKVFARGNPQEIQQLRARENYLVTIKAGSGKPGAQEQQQAQALELYREKAINREALLNTLQWPGRDRVLTQMRQEELEDIRTRAEGKELGLALNEQLKQSRPGRRDKS